MENRITLIIIGIVALLIGVLVYTQYEYRDVPQKKPTQAYQLDSKYPSGLWMFHQVVEEAFCGKYITLTSLDDLADRRGSSLIAINGQDRFGRDREKLLDYVKHGNSAFISSTRLSAFAEDSIYTFSGAMKDKSYFDSSLFGLTDSTAVTYLSPPYPQEVVDTFSVKYFRYFTEDLDHAIAAIGGEYGIAYQFDIEGGRIIYHSAPNLFTNTILSTEAGINHCFHMLSTIQSDTLLIYDPSTYYADTEDSANYLTYIFAQRSLKTAYLLSLAGMLLFVLFNSKRVQKVIPVQYKNRNTLGEYVDTLTELNYSIGNHSEMIKTMKDTFYHTVYNTYYIEKNDVDFVSKFAKKSKIPERQIEVILRRFEESTSLAFTSDQLTALYYRIQTVYQIIGN